MIFTVTANSFSKNENDDCLLNISPEIKMSVQMWISITIAPKNHPKTEELNWVALVAVSDVYYVAST